MAEKKSEQNSWTDPKDFGFPYVEIKTLAELKGAGESLEPKPEPAPDQPRSASELRAETKEKLTLAAKQKIHSSKLNEEVVPEQEPDSQSEKEPATQESHSLAKESVVSNSTAEKVEIPKPTSSPKKKSNSWIAYAAIIALFLVATIVWQLMKEDNGEVRSSPPVASSTSSTNSPEKPKEEIKNTATEEIQPAENQDSISNSKAITPSIGESTETGTTIDHSDPSALIRIEAKEARPQYFIVVGSLPNESLAIKESVQFQQKNEQVYLILPYEEVPHFRLAIGKFSSFTKANAKLEQIKADYTEALWILKY